MDFHGQVVAHARHIKKAIMTLKIIMATDLYRRSNSFYLASIICFAILTNSPCDKSESTAKKE